MQIYKLVHPESRLGTDHVEGFQKRIGQTFFFKTQTDRKKFTCEQREELLSEYKGQPYPSLHRRQELAERMNMSPRSIQIWFQNKRQRAAMKKSTWK
ncbi:hypothetical protein PROFUN_04280 [Planoprotostelium fungivorum]|uniref:Homeobox domain-containing protein n=1 Tax=Planoprotostelium fungivorum TaxID=1890364 RepID=A0A2P6NV57_9EUKA|nr:hypothetical protein PROFUN_04280 [Planoprotostelium fungivorum]